MCHVACLGLRRFYVKGSAAILSQQTMNVELQFISPL